MDKSGMYYSPILFEANLAEIRFLKVLVKKYYYAN